MQAIYAKAARTRLAIFDVDGVLTDGSLYYTDGGEEIKAFHTLDGHGLKMLQESLAKMPADDRAMGERIHELVSKAVPGLVPGTYYGMPSYRTEGKNGKTIGWYKPKSKFKVRYSTFGFQDTANLDDGTMWPTAFALTTLTAADEKRIGELVKKAAG